MRIFATLSAHALAGESQTRLMKYPFPTLTADEAAALINDKDTIGFGGFTAAGACKVIPLSLAARAKA